MPARDNPDMMNGRTRRAANSVATNSLFKRLSGRIYQKAPNSQRADFENLARETSILRFRLALANAKSLLAQAREDTLAVTSYCDLLAGDSSVTNSLVTSYSIPKQEVPAEGTDHTRIRTSFA
jgi:hypothetical protein